MVIDVLVIKIKQIMRAFLGPILPAIRSLRTRPDRRAAKKQASALIKDDRVTVCYLTNQFPKRPALRSEISHGGAVKMTFLGETFPHSYPKAAILYIVSSVDHVAKAIIVQAARAKGLKIVLNQNGVSYRAWYGPGWEEPNRKMRGVFKQADFIVYQSKFCQVAAEKFLGKATVPSQVIYNPVDLDLYYPSDESIDRKAPVLLLGGNQFATYRFEVAIKVLQQIIRYFPSSRLVVTGKLWGENQKVAMAEAFALIQKYGVASQVDFTGQYTQEKALQIFHQADILIHTQYNDASPTLIGEALACGLPVVYSASGGTPELVGTNAGIGIQVEHSWERINTPDPTKMAAAVLNIWEKHKFFKEAARQFAVENFTLSKFIQAHQLIFSQLLDQ
jgi:glycosyltransferase involved in cell wall biosynthesis